MKPLPHHYEASLTGGASGYATLSTAGAPDLRTAPPAAYDGSKEQCLVSASLSTPIRLEPEVTEEEPVLSRPAG